MRSNLDNMKQAVFEIFGVGSGAEAKAFSTMAEEMTAVDASFVHTPQTPFADAVPVVDGMSTPSAPMGGTSMSYIAAGTVFEGTMRCDGDVDIVGEFKGDVEAKGAVNLYASMEGNITAGSLTLAGCTLTGNATLRDTLTISETAVVCGNISAKDVYCAGEIRGDMDLSGHIVLERTAKVRGSVSTGSFAVEKGALLCGGVEIKLEV